MIKKITTGFVIQDYVTLNGKHICVSQDFIAGDQVNYETVDGDTIFVNTDNEVYCPFEMKTPKQVGTDGLKFVCPSCNDNRLEQILDGYHRIPILNIDKDGDFDYGEYESKGTVIRIQCSNCGYVLEDEPGIEITENIKTVEWIKNNCE